MRGLWRHPHPTPKTHKQTYEIKENPQKPETKKRKTAKHENITDNHKNPNTERKSTHTYK